MAAVYEADPSFETREADVLTVSILTAHYFRHNYASILFNAGVDVMSAARFLGHSDPTVTLKIYTHLSKMNKDANADKAIEALSKQSCQKVAGAKSAVPFTD